MTVWMMYRRRFIQEICLVEINKINSIDYDAIGNPTTYRGATLGWSNGRQLTS